MMNSPARTKTTLIGSNTAKIYSYMEPTATTTQRRSISSLCRNVYCTCVVLLPGSGEPAAAGNGEAEPNRRLGDGCAFMGDLGTEPDDDDEVCRVLTSGAAMLYLGSCNCSSFSTTSDIAGRILPSLRMHCRAIPATA